MKNLKTSKISLLSAMALAVASSNSFAATANYAVGFTTVPDITIIQTSAMDLGSGIFLASGSSCDLAVTDHTGTGYAGDALMRISRDTDEAQDAAFEVLGGTSTDCVDAGTATGTHGMYEITGIAGGTVNITVNAITTGTDFNFVPSGCAGHYDGAADGDLCSDISGGGAVAVRIADAADTVGNTGLGSPAPGKTFVSVGGTLTTTSVHTANTLMTEQFTIDVTY